MRIRTGMHGLTRLRRPKMDVISGGVVKIVMVDMVRCGGRCNIPITNKNEIFSYTNCKIPIY
jgi:hypothetical protein